MYFKSKKTSLLILGITAIALSRAMFVFFDDPEGPKLLVVMVGALAVYLPSLAVYVFGSSTKPQFFPSLTGLKRLLLVILIQIIIVTNFYFCLK